MNIKRFLLKRYPVERVDYLWAGNYEEMRLQCPFCGDDREFHFYINLRSGRWQCFRCAERGNSVYTFIKKIEPDRYKKLLEQYRKAQQDTSLSTIDSSLKKHVESMFRGKEELPPPKLDNVPLETKVIMEDSLPCKYLKKRSITLRMTKKYKLCYTIKGQLAFRIIIPFFEDKQLVYYLGRTYINGKPKILNPFKNSSIKGKNEVLYNYDSLQNRGEACIVEGVFDCITVDQIMPTVALCGKTISKKQVSMLLKKRLEHLYLFLDSDTEGESDELYKRLRGYFDISMIVLKKDDPNSIGISECARLIKESKKIDYKSYIEHKMRLKLKQ